MKAYYYWEGSSEPEYVQSCKRSWIEHGLDAEKIDLDYRDFLHVPYVKKYSEIKNWAFVSDYLRYVWFKNHEGLYLDSDMFICRNIPEQFLNATVAVSCENTLCMSNGIMKFSKNCSLIDKLCSYYEHDIDISNPEKSPVIFNRIALNDIQFRIKKSEIKIIDDITIFGYEYCYPLLWHKKRKPAFTENTFGIHQWHASADNGKMDKLINSVYETYGTELNEFLSSLNMDYFVR